jgi:spore maturation protein CgeB
MTRILIVGDFHSHIYEEAFYNSMKKLNLEVSKFSWWQYFKGYQYGIEEKKNIFKTVYYKIQNKFMIGPSLSKLNFELIKTTENFKPDLVFIYRGTHILPETIKIIKNRGAVVFGYNNDDPFSHKYPKYFWRHFIKSIKIYDHLFIYREKNIKDLISIGYKKFSQLRSYYIKEDNYPITNASSEKYDSDVIFVGHFEDDGRDEYLKYLIDNGIKLKIFGGKSWEASKLYDYLVEYNGPIINLRKGDYNLALNCSSICLVFLSKINNDSYTRRCFEIPATKKLMLSEYTKDLDLLFKEDKESVYFRSKEELLEKVIFYLNNSEARLKIAEAGYNRLLKDGHEVFDRVKEIMRVYNIVKNEKNINS